MNHTIHEWFIDFLSIHSGLSLTSGKAYLIESRLAPIIDESDSLASLDDIARKIREGDERLANRVVDAMTTNETLFFRDSRPFDLLFRTVIPEILQQVPAGKRLRIWSAACATGQEPFSIAMGLLDGFPDAKNRFEIVATDISSTAIKKARSGTYSSLEIKRGLPSTYRTKYFSGDSDSHQLSREVLDLVRFQEINLTNSFLGLGRFDVIFCRNVLIYFDADRKRNVLERMSSALTPAGYLFLNGSDGVGVTETLTPMSLDHVMVFRSSRALAR